ncbi:MAG TPA: metal-dependent hydrolase [Saprospiraceae bacterium]|nr:metal-dependent hydrolase [Saprospiraceae bacterium]
MDSLTHVAIGACIGEAFFEKGFGKRAMLWGMLAQSIPDIDFLAGFWSTTPETLLAHRGFTHSILFGLLIVPVFALIAERVHRPHNITFRKWMWFFAIEVFTHLFIDAFNNYGIGWFEPFSHHRFSFNAIYVADPFFSIWPGIACGMLVVLNSFHKSRTFWWRFGLILPAVYLLYCSFNKLQVNHAIEKQLTNQNIPQERYFTTPAPLQNWLWFAVSGNDDGYAVGYLSVFDKQDPVSFRYFPRNDSILKPFAENDDVRRLLQFSQQYYTVEKWHDTIVFNDLRFGQETGWDNPNNKFVFHYYLNFPKSNDLVVQRGRFEGWNSKTLGSLWKSIRGD